jgi:uncharacterized protein
MQDPLKEKKPNRLIDEKSPYLLQHAYNPVEWYPWCAEAFNRAKDEDKPVFVSIGYSSCHWCHVMEKECFEDKEVATLMNQAFICVKIDREERPDLDAVYMTVCQVMGQNCGWPLNVIMSPDKNPFFITSYIPKNSRLGLVGMVNLIPQISEAWQTQKSEIEKLGGKIKQRISQKAENTTVIELGKDVLDNAYEQLFLRFDQDNGGFGTAPKFPTAHNLLFLVRYWNRTREKNAWLMVEKTLNAIRLGGIFDQLGFGFHRYSTDALWLVPHFEKMLYDQALLVLAYTEAYQASGELKYMLTAKETLDYVLRDLTSKEGGFYSAEDADSEGEEGKFYLWTQDEIKQVLPTQEADLVYKIFGVKNEGNYFEPAIGKTGKNILYLQKPIEQTAAELNANIDDLTAQLRKIQRTLFEVRSKRVHPAKDDKVLVDWNGLMIAALARASQFLDEPKYLEAAIKAADFILENMQGKGGELYHRYAKGERAVESLLDDYAYLVFGFIELYEACFEEKYLLAANSFTKRMIVQFWDEEVGGFYIAANNEEGVPRLKQTYDGAIPSGASVALLNLLRLNRLIDGNSFAEYADKLVKVVSEEVSSNPVAHTFMLVGLDFELGPVYSVVLVGDSADKDMHFMLGALRNNYLPNLVVSTRLPIKAEATSNGVSYEKIDGKTTAYVCRNQTCMPPTNEIGKMLELLGLPKKK